MARRAALRSAGKLLFMPFYGGDFYGDEAVKLMTRAEQSMYQELMWHQWREGSIPGEPEEISRLVREPEVPPRVLVRFPIVESGRRQNPKVEEVRQHHARISRVRSQAGKAGRAAQLDGDGKKPRGQKAGKKATKNEQEADTGDGKQAATVGEKRGERREEESKQLNTDATHPSEARVDNSPADDTTADDTPADDETRGELAEPGERRELGEWMGVLRRTAYRPDGQAPDGHKDRRCASVYLQRRRKGESHLDLCLMLHGIARLQDRGELAWLKPGAKWTALVLNDTHSGARDVGSWALDAYREPAPSPPARNGKREDAPVRIGNVITIG